MEATSGFSATAQSRLAALYALFMGLVIAVFVATGLTLVYPVPEEPVYPEYGLDSISAEAQRVYDQNLEKYREQNETRSIVLGVLGMALGTGVAAAGLATERRIGVLGNGLVMGGLLTLVWANARFLYNFDFMYVEGSRLLVAVIAGVLSAAIFIAVGRWKFVRDLAPEEIDAGSRRQLHGFYTVLLGAALVYAFTLIWVYARTPIDTYPNEAYGGEALMYAIYSLVYSTALVSVGLALGGKRLGALSGGFVFAGFAGLLSSVVGALINTGDAATKFVFVTLALGVTTAAGYLRFIRKPKTATLSTVGSEVAVPLEVAHPAVDTAAMSESRESTPLPRTSPNPFEAAQPVGVGHLAAQRDRRVLWDPRERAFMLGDERLDAAGIAGLQAANSVLWYPDVIAEHPAAAAALQAALGR
jgi:hypothetical protein